MLWTLKYMGPKIDAEGERRSGTVPTEVLIDTITDEVAEAQALADAFIQELAWPSARKVFLRRAIAIRTIDVPALAAQYGQYGAPAAKASKPVAKPEAPSHRPVVVGA